MKEQPSLVELQQAHRELPSPETRRALRREAGLSLADIGRAVGVTRQAVSGWESGRRTPRGHLLVAYVAVLRQLRGAA